MKKSHSLSCLAAALILHSLVPSALYAPPVPQKPIVTTSAASDITATNATLNGTVNPSGIAASAYFQYGLDITYGDTGGFTNLLATNGVLTMPPFVVSSVTGPAGADWIRSANAPEASWTSIASSADGTRLAAGIYGGGIYTSTNSGVTWTGSGAIDASWTSIASSADGTRLAAVIYDGGIYASTNSGATWVKSGATNDYWQCIACSADGLRLAAGVYGGGICISTNGGATWAGSDATNAYWQCVTCSADGTRLAAVDNSSYGDGGIYFSTDSGATWTESGAPLVGWQSIAGSADGLRLAAMSSYDGIYISMNGGGTWVLSSAPIIVWQSIASSSDGQRLAAVAFQDGIYTSTNGGGIWTQTSAPGNHWNSIASSTAGTRLAAGVSGGGIYTSVGAMGGLSPGTTYHYRLVGTNSAGITAGADLTFTTGAGQQPVAFSLAASSLAGGLFQLSFTNLSGLPFTVLGSTNLDLPLAGWTVLGAPVEGPSGTYQFTDAPSANSAARFYRVSSP